MTNYFLSAVLRIGKMIKIWFSLSQYSCCWWRGVNICKNRQPSCCEWTLCIPIQACMFSWTFWALLACRGSVWTSGWEGHGQSAGTESLPHCAGCISSILPPQRLCETKGASSDPRGKARPGFCTCSFLVQRQEWYFFHLLEVRKKSSFYKKLFYY